MAAPSQKTPWLGLPGYLHLPCRRLQVLGHSRYEESRSTSAESTEATSGAFDVLAPAGLLIEQQTFDTEVGASDARSLSEVRSMEGTTEPLTDQSVGR